MKRRFIVCIDEETSEDVSSFIKYAREQGFGWWHWISNVWLLTTHKPEVKAGQIRDEARKITGDKSVVVLEVQPVTWRTFGPTGEKSIAKWIRDSWSKP